MLTWLTKGRGGFGQILTLADKGGGGVWTPKFLADIICEHPLTLHKTVILSIFYPAGQVPFKQFYLAVLLTDPV